jgi:hypothetical protein
MAGQFRFKNNSGTVVAQISASNAGAMSFSGSALDFSSVTTLTLGTTTLSGTASFATTAVSSSYGLNALTGSNAMTASSADTLYVRNNATVLGSITAQTLVVQTVTSSIDFVTGSTRFGSLQANTHIFTGSLSLTGSAVFLGGNVGIGTTTPSQLFEVVGGEIKAGRVDSSNEGGQVSFGRATDNATAWYIDAYGNVASPQLRFVDVTGAAVRMTITGSNVGIGTSSPATFLHVVGPNTSNRGQLCIQSNNVSNAGRITWYYDTFNSGEIGTSGSDFYALATGVFQFYAGGAERMRISGGDALFGTTTSSGNATGGSTNVGVIIEGANGAITTQRNNSANIFCSKASGFTEGTLIHFFTQGINRGSITTNGVNTAYNTSSDYRLKEDLKEYNGLNIISKLKTYDFKWKDTNIRDYGVMAHELQEVLPNYVNGDKDAVNNDGTIKTQAVDYSKIVPVLVKAIQELSAKVTLLENK